MGLVEMDQNDHPNRRQFLKKIGVASTVGILPGCWKRRERRIRLWPFSKEKSKKQNDMLNEDEGLIISSRIKGIYGFRPTFDIFKGRNVEEISKQVHSWGVNALWIEPRFLNNPSLIETLQAWQIKVFTTVGMFMGWKGRNRPITADGIPFQRYVPNHWYEGTCPNQPDQLENRIALIRRLAAEYRLDGVWLDGIRYPTFWETPNPSIDSTCFDPVCLLKFENWLGVQIPKNLYSIKDKAKWILENHNEAWYQFRMDSITDITKKCAEALKDIRPQAKLGIFSVPWRRKETRGGEKNAIERIMAQDYPKLAQYVDVFSPMVYHRMCGEPVEWIEEIVEWVARETEKPVWPIIQAHGEPRCEWNPYRLRNDEFVSALSAADIGVSEGVIVYSMEYILADSKLQILARSFKGLKTIR